MKCYCAGYQHGHDQNFCINQPGDAEDWLLLIIKTRATFYIANQEIHTKPNTVILFPPHVPRHYTADENIYIDDWMHFQPDEADLRLFQELHIPLGEPLHLQDTSSISTILRDICFEFYSTHQGRDAIVSLYFQILLYRIRDLKEYHYTDTALTETNYIPNLLWVRESIFRWPERDWNANAFADELSISCSHFQHIYVATFGNTMTQDIIDSRIQKACTLLIHTDDKIENISVQCGYNSSPHFVKLFKEKVGVTPAAYRRNNKKSSV